MRTRLQEASKAKGQLFISAKKGMSVLQAKNKRHIVRIALCRILLIAVKVIRVSVGLLYVIVC